MKTACYSERSPDTIPQPAIIIFHTNRIYLSKNMVVCFKICAETFPVIGADSCEGNARFR
jgi:hypothetical protein